MLLRSRGANHAPLTVHFASTVGDDLFDIDKCHLWLKCFARIRPVKLRTVLRHLPIRQVTRLVDSNISKSCYYYSRQKKSSRKTSQVKRNRSLATLMMATHYECVRNSHIFLPSRHPPSSHLASDQTLGCVTHLGA